MQKKCKGSSSSRGRDKTECSHSHTFLLPTPSHTFLPHTLTFSSDQQTALLRVALSFTQSTHSLFQLSHTSAPTLLSPHTPTLLFPFNSARGSCQQAPAAAEWMQPDGEASTGHTHLKWKGEEGLVCGIVFVCWGLGVLVFGDI